MRNMLMILAIILLTAGATACHAQLDCSAVTEVELDGVYAGDNTGLPNNVTTYGCSDWEESGGEVVYHLYLATPRLFNVRLESVCDLDLAILSGCDVLLDCIEVTDNGAQSASVQLGDFYFVVDGYEGAACAFQLFIDDGGVANTPYTFGQVKAMYGS